MKLAVLADIHANFVALQAVAEHLEVWQPDGVIVAGDIVNRGPRPRDCLEFIQRRQRTQGWLMVRGNHEEYILRHARPGASRSGLAFEIHRNSYWTYQQLGGDTSALAAMPFQHCLTAPDESTVWVTHASIGSNREGIYPEMSDDEVRQRIEPTAALFCVGHTHRPLIRRIDNTLVVNAGAVGLPFDGDPRPSYAQLNWQHGQWQAEIIRLNYNQPLAERDFFETDFLTEGGALAPLILDEFRTAQSHLFQWTEAYQARVLAGEISMEESAREFLAKVTTNEAGGTRHQYKSES